ncbi:MAG TPA: DMT family transporter [Coleofasciculaceae cyanobacterium]|jgi:drug/metabolite transporter (DMT)-like permease
MNNIVVALSYAFCWGIGATLTKITLAGISAATLLVLQLLSSVLFLVTIYGLKHRQLPFSKKSFAQGRAGIFEPALAYMVGIFGLQMTTASNATLIGASEVVLTILFAAVFLGETLTKSKLLLGSISFAGVLLLMLNDTAGASHASLLGDLLVLLGTIFAVFYVLLSKRQIETTDPLQLTASQQLVGLIMTVICFGILSVFNPTYEVNVAGILPQFWLLAVVSGILQYALAFLLYLIALQKVPVSHAAFYVALIPVFGIASAMILLGEQPSFAQWIGAACVITSSYYASRLKTE